MLIRPFKQELEIKKNLQCTFLFTAVFYQKSVVYDFYISCCH